MDVLNGIVVDALLKPLSWGERRMAYKHLRFTGAGDLVLLDRGYAGVGFFKRILATGADLCARVKLGHSKAISEFVASGRQKAVVRLTDEDGSISLMAVRIELASNITEVLLTSLNDWSCKPELFGRIYNLRWGVESEYHFLKAPLQLENFSGKTVHAVEQDFYVRIFAAVLALPVHARIDRVTAHCNHAYQLQWTEAFALFRRHLVKLVLGTTDVVTKWLRMLPDHMTSPRNIVRPARHFPRKQSLRPVRYPINQKAL
jgi:hypothetical protein